MTTPRFKVESQGGHATVTWLCDTGDLPANTRQSIPVSLASELRRLYASEAEHEDVQRALGQALDEAAGGAGWVDRAAAAIILCNALHEGWDDPDGWDYGLLPVELGDRKRDGHRVQVLAGEWWCESSVSERFLRDLFPHKALHHYRASKQSSSPPASTTEKVPWWTAVGRTYEFDDGSRETIHQVGNDSTGPWFALSKLATHNYSGEPFVNDDGTVTVLVDAPAATSDKGRVMGAQRFRKKPVVVAAVRIDADDYDDMSEIVGWCGGTAVDHDGHVIAIDTLEGRMFADPGDWIIQGVKGEFYPCKPDVFEQSYEAAS